jgi:hypothetical protein
MFKASMGTTAMTSFEKFNALAASRGDGLHPRLRDLLERAAIHPFSEIEICHNGMRQSGPNPGSEMSGSANVASFPREKCVVEADVSTPGQRKLVP